MTCPFQDIKPRTQLVFVSGKQEHLLRISTFLSLMMDSMNLLRNFTLELHRFIVDFSWEVVMEHLFFDSDDYLEDQ